MAGVLVLRALMHVLTRSFQEEPLVLSNRIMLKPRVYSNITYIFELLWYKVNTQFTLLLVSIFICLQVK